MTTRPVPVPEAIEKRQQSSRARGPSWLPERERIVEIAIKDRDVDTLRRVSAQPGGFGTTRLRRKAWRVLLSVDRFFEKGDEPTDMDTPHPDERQVLLDIRRSFVTYPRDVSKEDKARSQEDLRKVITSILRRHPRLSYFQGYHDIISVFYLSMLDGIPRSRAGPSAKRPVQAERDNEEGAEDERKDEVEEEKEEEWEEDEQWVQMRQCAEIVSLCRVRDAMGKGLEPMMGYLKILRRVLRLADPHLYRLSAQISPVPTLPFFALSWILTLFSHDIDTLEPVQRIFDYLVARNPVSAIYLAVAILCAKKPQMIALVKQLGQEARSDPSLLHPLFSRLPPLYPDSPDLPDPPPAYDTSVDDVDSFDEPNPYSPLPLSQVFALADRLMVKYPWNGPRVAGDEILGPGSVVCTYPTETERSLCLTEEDIDNQVVLPGGDRLDDDEDDGDLFRPWLSLSSRLAQLARIRLPSGYRLPIRAPPNKLGTAVAVGILALGIGLAYYGRKSEGLIPRGWGGLVRAWAARGKLGDAVGEWGKVVKYLGRAMREIAG